jgi:hypothetical protein
VSLLRKVDYIIFGDKIHYLNYFHEFYMQMFKFELCDDVPCATGEIGDRISTVVVVSSIQHKIQNRK